jgi:hypothetical protein
MGGRLITPRSANNLADLADGVVAVRAHGRQARQNTRNGASVRLSPEHPAIPCAARSRCRRTARNRARLGLHLVVVALASNAAAPACDQATAPCRHSSVVFLSAPPGSVLRPEARQGRTLHGAVYATSQNIYDLHLH